MKRTAPDARCHRGEEPEQRVIRQLVEALLFERLVPFRAQARCGEEGPEAPEPIYDLRLDCALGARQLRCVAAIGAFDRVRIAPGSIACDGGSPRDLRLIDVVGALGLDADATRRLLGELEQTVALCRWNRDNLPHQRVPRRNLSFQQLESAIVEGHPYHPSFKTRTGFSLQDHREYGFEAGNTFQLEWLAVGRSSLRMTLPDDEAEFWRSELGASEYAALIARLTQRGGDLRGYALVPVHPWQLRAIRSLGIDAMIEARTVIPLGTAGDRYHASQSLRTLVNVSDPRKANVKLPLDITCTSTHRNLVEHFVCTAPALSSWLTSLVAGDAFLQAHQRLVLLEEYAAIVHPAEHGALEGRLGVIFRESVCSKLAAGEAAVPFTALTVLEADGRPFIADWVDAHGARQWSERLLEVMLVPLWHMLVHHGVAFESHAQNLILIHRDGWPTRIVLRDFHEDTEFVPDYLRAPEAVPDFAKIDPYFATVPDDDGYRMASTEALRELFMDCVYVYNLSDVSFLLARFFGFPEADFWSVVRTQLRDYAQSGVTERARIARVACDSAEIVVESLLTKKVRDGVRLDFFEHRIRNTLHG